MINVSPVIICGGYGTRLWPLSRSEYPKQFLYFGYNRSLFQQAILRLGNIKNNKFLINEPTIIASNEHRFIVLEQLREISVDKFNLILEPSAKNTAPALSLATHHIKKYHNNSIMIVTPADQIVDNNGAFLASIKKSLTEALSDQVVVLGVQPTHPETGFGYIKSTPKDESSPASIVEAFIEKPSKTVATEFFQSKNYFWNSGIFVLKPDVWLAALNQYRPDIAQTCLNAYSKHFIDNYFIRPDEDLFKLIPSESIDYAVIEKLPSSDISIKVVMLDAGWSDLGSWSAVWKEGKPDKLGNLSKGDNLLIDTEGSLVYSENKLVTVLGLRNIIVVETSDAVLVMDQSKAQEIKHIVNKLKGRKELANSRRVFRPWGWFDTIDQGENFKVKRIFVSPNSSLSMQSHAMRTEHWIVVKGQAHILCDNSEKLLNVNESTYIPLGAKHRLSNKKTTPLEIIEIQSGLYLEEDDIIRYDDAYGREKD